MSKDAVCISKTASPLPQKHNYGIDILRILSMLMICTLHILNQGGVLTACESDPVRFAVVNFLNIALFCCVNCYALISGYVGLNAKHRYSNLLLLWLEVVLYNVIVVSVFYFAMPGSVTKAEISEALLPVTCSSSRWYFRAYFLLFFLMPLLNFAVKKLPRRRLAYLTVFLLALCAALTLANNMLSWGFSLINSTLMLAVFYLMGAYFKEYGCFPKVKSRYFLMCFAASTVTVWLIGTAASMMPDAPRLLSVIADKLVGYLSPAVILNSVCLFVLFVRIENVRCKRLLKTAGSLTFGVYIIHTAPLLFNLVLKDAFSGFARLHPAVMLFAVILTSAAVYTVCSLIEYLRQRLFGVLKIKETLQSTENRIREKLAERTQS
ncbi:MAG: acyltransferase family protein [Clostridia bacterium]|nr:acyltransferase family protein [Clostridia bacterium]